tara:strand:+ start:19983 stop:20861 length:879 start_codon:yes stop_codon:yes gene_type:complete
MTDSPQYRRRRAVWRILRLAVVAYVAILIYLVAMETRLVYPGAYFDHPLNLHGAGDDIETVDVHPDSDIRLPARLIRRPQPRRYVLFLHGNGIRAAQLDHWTRRLADTFDATVLTAEYRGYEDDRTPDETGIIDDALIAHDYLESQFDLSPDQIIVYGRSLGGAAAAAVAHSRGAQALILDRTFDAIWRVAAAKYPFVPVKLLMRNRFESARRLADYQGAVIQVHGVNDTLIPIERGRSLFDQLSTKNKVWIEVPDMEHNDRMQDRWLERIATEIERLSDPRPIVSDPLPAE